MRLIDSGSSYMNPKEAKSSLYSRRPVFFDKFYTFQEVFYSLWAWRHLSQIFKSNDQNPYEPI